MTTPTTKTPSTSPAHTSEDSQPSTLNPASPVALFPQSVSAQIEQPHLLTGKPTLHGPPPPGLERRFAPAPAGQVPEWCKLPSPRERCPFTGASRSWILDQEKLGRIRLVRVRQPGRMRGACFVFVPSLLALLRGELEKQTATPEAQAATRDGKEGAR